MDLPLPVHTNVPFRVRRRPRRNLDAPASRTLPRTARHEGARAVLLVYCGTRPLPLRTRYEAFQRWDGGANDCDVQLDHGPNVDDGRSQVRIGRLEKEGRIPETKDGRDSREQSKAEDDIDHYLLSKGPLD